MAYIKLPYNEIVEISAVKAEGIERAMIEKERDRNAPDRLIDLGTRRVKLSQVKEVDTSDSVSPTKQQEKKYDINRDHDFLVAFGNEVRLYGGFENYCLEKQLLIPSRAGHGILAVNLDKHMDYTDACERWDAVKQIYDLTISREERLQGIEVLRAILILNNRMKVNG